METPREHRPAVGILCTDAAVAAAAAAATATLNDEPGRRLHTSHSAGTAWLVVVTRLQAGAAAMRCMVVEG